MRARAPFPFLALFGMLLATPAAAQSRPSGICPGLLLAYSCGNKTCEPGLSENASNCPQDCLAAPLKSYNNLKACTDVDLVRNASSPAQVQQFVNEAIAGGQKVKVTGNRHSISDVICTSGVVIKSSAATIHSTGTFEGEDTVLVDAGVKTGDLAEWLHARNKSLGYALMGFRLPTVGGAVATGSHGSSPKWDAVLASRVRWIELVDSRGALDNPSPPREDGASPSRSGGREHVARFPTPVSADHFPRRGRRGHSAPSDREPPRWCRR